MATKITNYSYRYKWIPLLLQIIYKAHIIEKDLIAIGQLVNANEASNEEFKSFLKTKVDADIDKLVFDLNEAIAPQIDCTACGNCCKSLLINVTEEEATTLARHLNQSRTNFDAQYLEKSGSMMLMNAIPCTFLTNDTCTVYEHRFAGCREFPAMHLPNFNKRLFTTFMHYGRCPIIYNIVEELKVKTGFKF